MYPKKRVRNKKKKITVSVYLNIISSIKIYLIFLCSTNNQMIWGMFQKLIFKKKKKFTKYTGHNLKNRLIFQLIVTRVKSFIWNWTKSSLYLIFFLIYITSNANCPFISMVIIFINLIVTIRLISIDFINLNLLNQSIFHVDSVQSGLLFINNNN